MATIPRHLAGAAFRPDRPILETEHRPTFDTSAQQNALLQVSERLSEMGQSAQVPLLPEGYGQHEGAGLSAIGDAIAGFAPVISKLAKQQQSARAIRDEEQANTVFQEHFDRYRNDAAAAPDRPEEHPGMFQKTMQGLKNSLERGDLFSKETQPIARQVFRRNYQRALPIVLADSNRALHAQALDGLGKGLERAVEQQDRPTGLRQIDHREARRLAAPL